MLLFPYVFSYDYGNSYKTQGFQSEGRRNGSFYKAFYEQGTNAYFYQTVLALG